MMHTFTYKGTRYRMYGELQQSEVARRYRNSTDIVDEPDYIVALSALDIMFKPVDLEVKD